MTDKQVFTYAPSKEKDTKVRTKLTGPQRRLIWNALQSYVKTQELPKLEGFPYNGKGLKIRVDNFETLKVGKDEAPKLVAWIRHTVWSKQSDFIEVMYISNMEAEFEFKFDGDGLSLVLVDYKWVSEEEYDEYDEDEEDDDEDEDEDEEEGDEDEED
jgi:hypothetical protein